MFNMYEYYVMNGIKKLLKKTHGGTRTRNPRLRRPMPYPLGHAGTFIKRILYYRQI